MIKRMKHLIVLSLLLALISLAAGCGAIAGAQTSLSSSPTAEAATPKASRPESTAASNKPAATPKASAPPSATPRSSHVPDNTTKSQPAHTSSLPTSNDKPASTPKATPTPTKKPIPLTKTTFTLTVPQGQYYSGQSIPIYVLAEQTLHLNWMITSGGDRLAVSVTTPGGQTVGVNSTGGLVPITPPLVTYEKLLRTGNIVFCPRSLNWTDGYYIVQPHITAGDSPVTVQVLHWVE